MAKNKITLVTTRRGLAKTLYSDIHALDGGITKKQIKQFLFDMQKRVHTSNMILKNTDDIVLVDEELSFKETLKLASKFHINSFDLEIANEVAFQFNSYEIKLTNKQFEKVCTMVKDAYLKSEDLTIEKLVAAYIAILKRDEKKITKRTIIDEACWY